MSEYQNNPSHEEPGQPAEEKAAAMPEKPEEFLTEAEKTDEATSTIFSAPKEHTGERKAGKHALLKKIVAAVLCVAVLAGGTVAVIRLIPEMVKDDSKIDAAQMASLFSYDASQLSEVTVTRPQVETLHLTGKMSEDSGKTATRVWSLEGYDDDLINQTSLTQIVGYAASVNYTKKFEEVEDPATYGLDQPSITVTAQGESVPSYTLTFGNTTADEGYWYLSYSQDPKTVYVVPANTATGYLVQPLDLAISTPIPAVSKENVDSKFYDEDGKLASFDRISLSGNLFPDEMVFQPNVGEDISSYAAYITVAPKKRIATNVDKLLNVFANGVTAASCVSFDQSAEKVHAFGLDDPDIVLVGRFGDYRATWRFKTVPDAVGTYYVLSDTDRLIRTVNIANAEFLTLRETDFYTKIIVMESIKDLSGFEVSGETDQVYAISYNSDTEEYQITKNGASIKADDFQTFYADFLGTSVLSYDTVPVSGEPSMTFRLQHNNGKEETVVRFYPVSDTRIQFSVGGEQIGQIAASAYKQWLKSLNAIG